MSEVSVEMVSRTMETLLMTEGRPIVYHDIATGTDLAITPQMAASPSGLLPSLVIAGEAIWRETTGKGFELDVVRDSDAFLGYRLQAIGAGSFTTVMLAAMEATAQITGPSAVVASDLNAVWTAATDRIELSAGNRQQVAPGSAP